MSVWLWDWYFLVVNNVVFELLMKRNLYENGKILVKNVY